MVVYVVIEYSEDEDVILKVFENEDDAADFCEEVTEHTSNEVTYRAIEFCKNTEY